MKSADLERRTAAVDNILTCVDRASGIIDGLLAAIGSHTLSSKDIDFKDVVLESVKRIKPSLGSSINTVVSISDEPMPVAVDPDAVGQCISELINNAKKATYTNGHIPVSCPIEQSLPSMLVSIPPDSKPTRYACVCVSDDGIGMDPEVMNRIIEPYFTNQELGSSTGIGLTKVYGIVHQHNGLIGVKSASGSGTTFKLYFPVTEG
jgi:signal transduction histidine kinase